MKTYQTRSVTTTKEVLDTIRCDRCNRLLHEAYDDKKTKCLTYFNVSRHHNEWGSDSAESYEYYEVCGDCLPKLFTDEMLPYLTKEYNCSGCVEIEASVGFVPVDYDYDADLAHMKAVRAREAAEKEEKDRQKMEALLAPALRDETSRTARMIALANELNIPEPLRLDLDIKRR